MLPADRTNLTPQAVAARLGVSRETVEHWMNVGRLRCIDVGTATRKFRRTSETWLAEFLAARGAAVIAPNRGGGEDGG